MEDSLCLVCATAQLSLLHLECACLHAHGLRGVVALRLKCAAVGIVQVVVVRLVDLFALGVHRGCYFLPCAWRALCSVQDLLISSSSCTCSILGNLPKCSAVAGGDGPPSTHLGGLGSCTRRGPCMRAYIRRRRGVITYVLISAAHALHAYS